MGVVLLFQPILMEQLDPHSELLCTTDKFYQLQLGSNHIYGLNFTLETDAQVFSTFVQSLLMPTTPSEGHSISCF